MKNKILSMLAVLAVSVNMVGCAPSDSSAPVEATGQVAVETTAEPIEMKTIDPPEDGWTVDELLSVTYVYGQQLENPCTLNTLGDDFSFDLSTFTYFEENNSSAIMLQYQNTIISAVSLCNCKNQEDICGTTEINGYVFNLSFENNNASNLYINGITFYSLLDKVIKQLGEPDIIEKASETTYIAYHKSNTNDNLLAMSFNANDELTSFKISY